MKFEEEEFDLSFKELSQKVQEKALEIAQKLMTEKGMAKSEALKKGVKQAEEWFLDMEG